MLCLRNKPLYLRLFLYLFEYGFCPAVHCHFKDLFYARKSLLLVRLVGHHMDKGIYDNVGNKMDHIFIDLYAAFFFWLPFPEFP